MCIDTDITKRHFTLDMTVLLEDRTTSLKSAADEIASHILWLGLRLAITCNTAKPSEAGSLIETVRSSIYY